jgi:hypothetical protein
VAKDLVVGEWEDVYVERLRVETVKPASMRDLMTDGPRFPVAYKMTD